MKAVSEDLKTITSNANGGRQEPPRPAGPFTNDVAGLGATPSQDQHAPALARRCRMEFYDVGAIVWILRKCVWWVPDFSVAE
jgi:hypothetical protein